MYLYKGNFIIVLFKKNTVKFIELFKIYLNNYLSYF